MGGPAAALPGNRVGSSPGERSARPLTESTTPPRPYHYVRSAADVGDGLQGEHEGVRPFPPAPLGPDRLVELLGEGEAGQAQVHPLRLGEGDAHVLDKVFDVESRLKVSGPDTRPEAVERLAPGGADRD